MSRWITFFRERFPLPVLFLISFGIALAGLSYGSRPLQPIQILLAGAITFLFFSTLRLMDEIKDYEKDKIVHPTRPLPRGLIELSEFKRVMLMSVALMFVFAALVAVVGNVKSAGFFAFSIIYLWLMYKEFYVGQALQKAPIVYAITHQIVLLPLMAASVFLSTPETTCLDGLLKPALMVMGGFFTYEICRKLDPNAHPMLQTYRHVYGLFGSGLLSAVTLGTGALGAALAYGCCSWQSIAIWVVEALTILSFVLFANKRPKIVEAMASLSLLIHIWLPTISYLFRG